MLIIELLLEVVPVVEVQQSHQTEPQIVEEVLVVVAHMGQEDLVEVVVLVD